MSEPVEDIIISNLIEALDRLQRDLDSVELWTAALDCFQRPTPDYQWANRYLLPASRQAENSARR